MTSPNKFSKTDTLAAREIVKGWVTPAFHGAIDAGEFDPWALMDRARAEVIRNRKSEEDMADG